MSVEIIDLNVSNLAERLSVIPTQITLEAGNKILVLSIDSYAAIAATRIDTIPNKPKTLGATTELYRQAFEIIKKAAAIIQEPIEYSFTTDNPTLIVWARHPEKGVAVFQWNDEDISEENGRLTAKKTIYPE